MTIHQTHMHNKANIP